MARNEGKGKRKSSSGYNRKAGHNFLEKNKQKSGVIETGSGLQYIVIDQGDENGGCPNEDSYVIVHQRCNLVNGTVIEDTYKENQASEVHMRELIDGYKEGLQLMRKNARYKLFIPPELAWGEKGTGTKIPPNAVLIFDIRLIDFW